MRRGPAGEATPISPLKGLPNRPARLKKPWNLYRAAWLISSSEMGDEENAMGRGLLLWLIGIPIPIILLVWILGGLHG
jgi:hypothetical protein